MWKTRSVAVLGGMVALGIGFSGCAHLKSGSKAIPLRPLIIAHRGASGYLPEHTLAGYEKAIEMGADYIELDLVSTKDGALIIRHENEISGTTDAAAKFPKRKRTQKIDGVEMTGWFSEDFTLAEVRTLRARERLPFRSQTQNGIFGVPTLEEVLSFLATQIKKPGRPIGIHIETKHPTFFRSIGLPIEPGLVAAVRKAGLDQPGALIFIQSFEVGNLRGLHAELPAVPLVLLMEPADQRPYDFTVAGDRRTYGELTTPAGLREIATFARGIGPAKEYIRPASMKGGALDPEPTSLVRDAHAAGLVVHPFTFRSDSEFLNAAYAGDPAREYEFFFRAGVDGVFSDFTADAVRARAAFCGNCK